MDVKKDKIMGKSKLPQSVLRAASRFKQRSKFKNMRRENYVCVRFFFLVTGRNGKKNTKQNTKFLISNFRCVLNVVGFLLGYSPAGE